MERRSKVVRGIWAACLVGAGLNHLRILVIHGLGFDYGGLGVASSIYLTSLTIIDPLIAFLLFRRPKAGIIGTLLLMVTNVAHNLSVTAIHSPDGEFLARATHPILLAQMGFLLFVLATARTAWRGVESRG